MRRVCTARKVVGDIRRRGRCCGVGVVECRGALKGGKRGSKKTSGSNGG